MTKKQLVNELIKYKKLCLVDTLTKLWNRRKLNKDVDIYLSKQLRYNTCYNIVMIDIDNFKQVNDTKGHLEGDKVLIAVANILKNNIRKHEGCYRLSGDEFILIVKGNNPMGVIKRIEKRLSKINISISYGISFIQEGVLDFIDREMYKNKRRKK